MSRLAQFSLRNRALVALATVLIAVFGVVSLTSLKLELIPSLQIPTLAVVAPYPGSAPEVVEQQVTIPLEDAAGTLDGVESVTSTSSTGVATVLVDLEYGTDLDAAQRELESAVRASGTGLPDEVEPTVIAGSLDDFPVVQLAVASPGDLGELADRVRADVVPRLSALDGVRDVTVSGAPVERIEIRLDQIALLTAGLSPTAVSDALAQNGSLLPLGTLTEGDRTLTVQAGQGLSTVDDVRALPLLGGAGAPLTLGDVAEVVRTEAPATSLARTNGEPSLAVAITKTPAGNTVDVSHAVDELRPELEEVLGGDATFSVVFDQAPFIEQSVEGLTTEGGLGLLFAVVVILVFLTSIRSTLVTAISIPLSVLVTFIGLYVGGYSLNILTLGALTVAIGRVVDDSIVVIENIKRHLSYGEPKAGAIFTAVKEVATAITSSTLATVAVFLPIAIVGGQVGELFRPFAMTVTIALLASLLVSLTIVPVLASVFLRSPAGEVDAEAVRAEADVHERRGRLQRGYLPVLRAAIRHPVVTVAVAVVLLVATGAASPLLKTNFLGDSGQNTLTVSQVLEPGTSLAAKDEAARAVEEVLLDVDGVVTVQTTVGGGEGFAAFLGGGSDASFAVTTDPDADAEALLGTVRAEVADLPDAGEITVSGGDTGFASAVEVVVTATDDAALDEASARVLDVVRGIDGVSDVTSNAAVVQPTVQVVVDRAAAAAAGLSEAAVAQVVAGSIQAVPVGSVTLDDGVLDVVLSAGAEPADLDALRATPVPTATGVVPLAALAAVEEVQVPTTVTRVDGDRSVTVSATPVGDDLGSLTAALQSALDDLELPAGASAEVGGVSADQSEAFGQLGLALVVAIAIVYLVMVATFRSLVQPLILLVSIPFAAIGALGLLLVTGVPLGVAALIGMLMLIGIVVTNAIVLIDLVNQYREGGSSPRDAVLEGARQRLRPILMTAAATILALTPMAFGLTGGGAFISQPLAIVVIGGLVSSTLLTLVLVPVLYLAVERLRGHRGRRVRHAA
ncbi:efflux RND transporter permease subunit [uncultured Cellulomonas sp.]|uniref:efflux RND transporter permease subunit n=1 Tax=uncultured Cellulomonas sp. TaxID=189682 RepID=UPI00263837C0|nr:efflux RND transporter permease subunit [uncultured Cellulomonas sp.]